jgi:isoleucyl-tRNA synthetase
VDPQDTTQKSGAEILRLWTIYGDYGQDVNCGETELTRVTETYRRIRNTMKFLLGATHDFDPATESVPYEKLTDIDKWALHRLFELTEKVTQAYEGIEFYKVYHLINNFFTVDLSAIYLDVLKDRLYTWKEKGFERKGSQTVLYTITDYITRMMAPVLSFLAEEVYDYAKGTRAESVFLLDFPVAQKEWSRPELLAQFDHYLKVREDVAKVLENLRAQKVIGSSLEAHVTIKAEGELLAALKNFGGLKELLIVSSVQVAQGSYGIEASKAEGEKCVRCWHFSTDTGKNTQFPAVCPKCVEALS